MTCKPFPGDQLAIRQQQHDAGLEGPPLRMIRSIGSDVRAPCGAAAGPRTAVGALASSSNLQNPTTRIRQPPTAEGSNVDDSNRQFRIVRKEEA
jgi:hypothetical protein